MININGEVQQISDCLQRYSTWGETHIVNICDNTNYIIPWGIEHYVTGILAGFMFLLLFGVMFGIAFNILFYNRN